MTVQANHAGPASWPRWKTERATKATTSPASPARETGDAGRGLSSEPARRIPNAAATDARATPTDTTSWAVLGRKVVTAIDPTQSSAPVTR